MNSNSPLPETLTCHKCPSGDCCAGVEVAVRGLGPVVNVMDPTQTYRLACGHLAI